MGDKCNCYRFSPRDSLSGAVAQIADYLSKHPGWNETELRTFVDGLISSAGVETFNGRSGNVTLNKDDVNNLLIANCYFAEADETIESIDVLALYKLGIRIVFTQYSSEVDGYTLAYGIEYYPATDTAKAYLFSSSSGGVGAVVSVNGKTGTVVLKAGDILMNNGDSVEDAVSNAKAIANAAYSPDNPPPYPVKSVNSKTGSVMLKVVDVSNGNSTDENAYMFIDESDDYPDVIAPDSSKLGGQLPAYYAPAEEVSQLKSDIGDAWTSGKTYVVGDYCICDNRLYKCKTAHTAGSSFTSSYWDSISITRELSNKGKYYRYDIEMSAGDKYFYPPDGTYFIIIRTQCGDYGGRWNVSCVQNDFINVLDTCDISWKTSYGVGIVTLTGQLTINVQELPTDPRNAQVYLITLS